MIVCTNCQKENPPDVRFCLTCGAPVAEVASALRTGSPLAVTVSTPPAFTAAASPWQAPCRPFGLVASVVFSVGSGLLWMFMATPVLLGAIGSAVAGRMGSLAGMFGGALQGVGDNSTPLFFVSYVLMLAGLVEFTAAIGVWTLADWGLKAAIGARIFGIVVGAMMVLSAGAQWAQASNITSGMILGGLVVGGCSGAAMAYLRRPEVGGWFRSNAPR